MFWSLLTQQIFLVTFTVKVCFQALILTSVSLREDNLLDTWTSCVSKRIQTLKSRLSFNGMSDATHYSS